MELSWEMAVGREFTPQPGLGPGKVKFVGSFSKSTNSHFGINAGKKQVSSPTDRPYLLKLTGFTSVAGLPSGKCWVDIKCGGQVHLSQPAL